jgi:hypothetical protein
MKRLILALSVSLLAACSSMQPVRVSDLEGTEAPPEIQLGDRVEVVSRDLTWLWGILGAALFVAIIASADSVSVCSPGPCPAQ